MSDQGQNIISLGFDLEKLTAEKKEVLDLFVDLFGKLQAYDGTKFNPLGGGGLADLKKSMTDSAKAMGDLTAGYENYNKVVTDNAKKNNDSRKALQDLTAEQKAAKKIQDDLVNAQAKLNASSSDGAKELAQLKLQQQQANAANKDAAKEALGLSSQYEKLNKTYEAAAKASREIGISKGIESDEYKQASAAAKELHDQLLKLEGDTGDKGRNVGNYAESLKGGFRVLDEQLQEVNKQLAEMELRGKAAAGGVNNLGAGGPIGFDNNRHKEGGAGPTDLAGGSGSSVSILNQDAAAYQKLTLQQKVLEGSLQRQTIGFKTANQEMLNAKLTLDALTLAGLQNSEGFEELNVAYTSAQQKVKDLHQEQAILTSDAPALTALTGIAKGIGGAYAIGAGGAALFADGNEKVEKELQKLVAVMTFLQGLEEATKALKDRNALATALEAEATRALNIVKKIEVAIFGNSATVTKAEAEAKKISTEAALANTEALEANAAGAEVDAAAVEGVAAAEGIATTATIAFRTALISTGIGAIIIGLIYGVTKLVSAISDWIGEDERAEKAQLALAESNSKLLDTFKELQEVYDTVGKERVEQLMREAELTKEAGKNQFIQLADEQRINDKRVENAKEFVDQYQISEKTVSDLNQKRMFDLETLQGFESSLSVAQQKLRKDNSSAAKKEVEELTKLTDQAEKDAKNSGTKYSIAAEAYKAYIDALNADEATRIKVRKAAEEELAKLTADAAQRRFDVEKAANDRILNAPTSGEDARIGALKANFDAEEQLAAAQIAAIQKQQRAQTITEKEGDDQIANIRTASGIKYKQYLQELLRTQIEFNDRRLDALNTVSKNGNESDEAIQDAVTKDLQQELENRLGALNAYVADKAKIIANDYATDLAKAKERNTTDEEYTALVSNRQKALAELTATTQKQIYEITISWGEKKIKAIQDLNKSATEGTEVEAGFNAQTEALNESLLDQSTSYAKYIRTKRDLDREYIKEKDAADVEDDEAALRRIKNFEENELASKKRIAEANLAVARGGGDQTAINNAKAQVDAIAELQQKARVDEKAASDQLNKDKAKQTADSVADRIKAEEILKDKTAELESTTFSIATSLVNDAYENRINQIQRTMERQDAAADAEIAAVQRSTLSQRDQQAELIILQNQKQARDTAQKHQEVEEKRREAKFDQGLAVAKTIWSTEQAIMKDTAGVEWPLSLAIGAVDAALGAAAVAEILAQSLPSYGDGTDNHPGGWALVGELYKPEEVKMPGHEPFIVDTPTLLDMPSGSSVTPLEMRNIVNEIGWGAISRGAAIMNAVVMDSGSDQIVSALNKNGERMERAFKKSQRKIQNTIHVHVRDEVWENYLDQKVRGRR